MEILLRSGCKNSSTIFLQKKIDADERIVRQELVQVWTRMLKKYVKPGAHIPSVERMRQELLDTGVDAAVDAVVDEHWFVLPFMIRDEIQKKVERGLERFDLAGFIEEVRAAQTYPDLVPDLCARIQRYVLFEI